MLLHRIRMVVTILYNYRCCFMQRFALLHYW